MINSNKGETFAETLVALLIGVLSLLMLSVSIVTSAKINHKIKTDRKLSTVEERKISSEEETDSGVTELGSDAAQVNINGTVFPDVKIFMDEAGYIYYEYDK